MTDHTSASPVNYYYLKNHHGDVVALMDSTGQEVVSYRYDVSGKILKSEGTKTLGNGKLLKYENPFRYASYFYDNESGLYYLNARYYDPELGRFITRDVIPALNLYVYAENSPVNFVDPSGYKSYDVGTSYGGSYSEIGNDINNKIADYYDTGGSRTRFTICRNTSRTFRVLIPKGTVRIGVNRKFSTQKVTFSGKMLIVT
jgi:RHS repeat-associated protein